MGKIDWTSIKTEYVSTEISIREIAEKHGVSVSAVKARSKKEGWVEARKQFQTETATKAVRKVEEQCARARARTILKAQRTAMQLGSVLNKIARQSDQFYNHIVSEGRGDGISETMCVQFDKPDTKALRDCTAALKDLTASIKELFGDPAQESTEDQSGVVQLPSVLEEEECE